MTVPVGVYVAVPLPAALTVVVLFSVVAVVVETVPVAVPLTLTVPSVPEKVAAVGREILPVTRRTPVPLNVGVLAVYIASPVLTVTFEVVIELVLVAPI